MKISARTTSSMVMNRLNVMRLRFALMLLAAIQPPLWSLSRESALSWLPTGFRQWCQHRLFQMYCSSCGLLSHALDSRAGYRATLRTRQTDSR